MDGEVYRDKVVGVTYRNDDGSYRQQLVRLCKPGEKLQPRREPDNPHDPHAIAVHSGKGQLGYLRGRRAGLARHLDRGGEVTLTVTEVTGGPTFIDRVLRRPGKSYGCNIVVEVHPFDWERVRPWLDADRAITNGINEAKKLEKGNPAAAVKGYQEVVKRIRDLDAQGREAQLWRTGRYPINRLSLVLERSGRIAEAVQEIERWYAYEDPVGINKSDEESVRKRLERLRKKAS